MVMFSKTLTETVTILVFTDIKELVILLLDIEIEQKDNHKDFLENKIGSPDSEVKKEMIKLGIKRM